MGRSAASRRVAFVNWTRRQAGGVETYVDFLLTAVAETGCQVALWTEQDHPVERDCVAVPAGATEWCAALDEPERSLEALRRWSPSVLLVHGVADPVMEARLLTIAPAVFVAHTYTGTCISSRKTLTFPRPLPCDRVFGPACLALFYPRRCGGLHPLTLIRDYRRQTAQLGLIQTYSHVLTMSQHMRREYVRHGVAPHRAHALPPYLPIRHVVGPRRGFRAVERDDAVVCRTDREAQGLSPPDRSAAGGPGPAGKGCPAGHCRRRSGPRGLRTPRGAGAVTPAGHRVSRLGRCSQPVAAAGCGGSVW